MTRALEAIVLFLVLFSAWPFGSVHAYFQWVLLTGVALLLAGWAARAMLEGRVLWVRCPITLGLATLCLLTIVQVLPLGAEGVAWLSPTTATLQSALLPTPAELAAAGLDASTDPQTLSVDPGATRACLVQLIAVLALFAAVRNNLRDPGTFYRLAWLCVANGVALALVGMGQLASSPPNVVFWLIPTRGTVFGPFICRNHFAYYANLCLGLAAGLLLGTRYFLAAPRGLRPAYRPPQSAWLEMFRDPRILWLASGVAILLAGLLACLSRGGILGLIVGAGVAALLMLTRPAMPRWAMSFGIIAFTALLVGWLGFDRVSRRWEDVWQDNAAAEARTTVWQRVVPLTGRFPIWGTGLGTFGLVEPLERVPGDPTNILHDHAHNDFLELWIEGGAGQLLVALVIIGLVVMQGVRAFARHSTNAMGRLALGALVGFIAVTVQSFVDFGLHVPAVAVLASVLAAMLANLAEVPESATIVDAPPPESPLPARWRLTGVLQAGALLTVALFLVSAGDRAEQAERFRLASRDAAGDRPVAYLRSAIARTPDRAELHVALVDALVLHADATAVHRQLLAAFAIPATTSAPARVATLVLAERMPALSLRCTPDVPEARSHALRARQLSPLSFDAQEKWLRLDAEANGADATGRGLARLLLLLPSAAAPWFEAGQLALRRGDREDAWRCWHNALRGDRRLLAAIARAVPASLSPTDLLAKVLPADPALIFEATSAVAPGTLGADDEQRYFRQALALLVATGDARTADECVLQARIHMRLDQMPAARDAYRAALARSPRAARWRIELCELLRRTGSYAEARQELRLLLDQEPGNFTARTLYQQLLREVAER